MTNVTLDLETVRRLAAEAVETRGEDYVYGYDPETPVGCVYVRSGKPSCLVGEIFHRAGVDIETLAKMDDSAAMDEAAEACGWGTGEVGPTGDVGIDDWIPWLPGLGIDVVGKNTAIYLRNLQREQDQGTPWGAALARAEREVPA